MSVVKGETKKKAQLTNFSCGNNNEGQAGYYKNLVFRQKNGASRPVGSTLPFSSLSQSAATLVQYIEKKKILRQEWVPIVQVCYLNEVNHLKYLALFIKSIL